MNKSAQTCLAGNGPVLQRPCFRCTKGLTYVPRSVRLGAKKIERGYFADVDPNEPVYAPMGGIDQVDFTKRGGRYTSDFIWNTRWKDQLDMEDSQKREKEAKKDEVEETAGGLSFHRVADLNSMDVDLSEQLRPRKQPTPAQASSSHVASAPQPSDAARRHAQQQRILYQRGQQGGAFERVAPSQGESRRWERSGRFQKRAATTQSQDPDEVAAREERTAAERRAYDALKQDLWRWSVGVTALFFAGSILLFSRDTAASYGVGALGGLMYLRLLNRSVDSLAASSMGAAGGQARFAIPVLLVLLYNRWNAVEHGSAAVHLELLPMLLGFFTYKAGVVGRGAFELLSNSAGSSNSIAPEDSATQAAGAILQAAATDVAVPADKSDAVESAKPSSL